MSEEQVEYRKFGWDLEFSADQKVWFNGLKAKVASFEQGECNSLTPMLWMVPIVIKGSVYMTIAHSDALTPR
jgi:hypothetical protein